MKRNSINISKNKSIVFLLAIVLMLNAACGSGGAGAVKNPLRDYSDKPFSPPEWLAGDAVERGRMTIDIFRNRIPNGKSKEDVLKLFGEPDKKTTIENREVWLYRVDKGHNQALPFFPVSFDDRMGTFVGSRKGGKMSMLVAE
jgi:hypothetical protein